MSSLRAATSLAFSGRSWQLGGRRLPEPWEWPMPEVLPRRGPGSDCSSSSGTPCPTSGRPAAQQLCWDRSSSILTSASVSGSRGTRSCGQWWTPLRRRPGSSALSSSSSGMPAGRTLGAGGPPEGEQECPGYSEPEQERGWESPGCRDKAVLREHTAQHRHRPTQVSTSPFLILLFKKFFTIDIIFHKLILKIRLLSYYFSPSSTL